MSTERQVLAIGTREAFIAWLEENGWLEDVVVESLVPRPGGRPPDAVDIRMWKQVGGSYVAGETRRVRAFRVTARRVSVYSLEGDLTPDHASQGAEIIECDQPVAFELDVPGRLHLCCEALYVAHTERTETVPGWLSRREFWCDASAPPPTPSEWREHFRAEGKDVVWRSYGGPGVEDAAVPDDYGGWFLQSPAKIPSDPGGVFFRSAVRTPAGCHLTLQSWYEDARALWLIAAKLVAKLPGVTVHCGNVRMPGAEWQQHMEELRNP
ncbi:MAG TPA: hypothetical protein VFY93_12905 [Planctomycetota bacterium]|nr:hypothetical protein [Planctomycetota bacterium]